MNLSTARILVVDDEAHIRTSIDKALTKDGYSISQAENGDEALEILRQQTFNLVICDVRMPKLDGMQTMKAIKAMRPETEVIMITGYGTVQTAVQAIKAGAYDFVEKPFKRVQLLKAVEKALEKQTLLYENQRLREALEGEASGPRSVIGISPAMLGVIELVNKVADSSATVLITGESGTGKEVIANAVHHRSRRRDHQLVKVSCAALPETLLEAELFGYEKGAFTGAVSTKSGRFELANRGTLFMDEVGEIPQSMQVKLLRVLQEGEFERLGGTKTLFSDVRLVAATNQDLAKLVEQGKFREDLYYRLNVINVAIPPLRERVEDIPLLVDHFVQRFSRRNKRAISGVSNEAMERLTQYRWPGNVRELENAIERAIVLSRDGVIDVEALPSQVMQVSGPSTHVSIPIGMKMQDIQQTMITETLKHTGGNRELAAKLLGIASRTIYRKLGARQHSDEPHMGHDGGNGAKNGVHDDVEDEAQHDEPNAPADSGSMARH